MTLLNNDKAWLSRQSSLVEELLKDYTELELVYFDVQWL